MNGMIMTSKALLDKNPHPSDAEIKQALEGNLCRCGSHLRVVRAVNAQPAKHKKPEIRQGGGVEYGQHGDFAQGICEERRLARGRVQFFWRSDASLGAIGKLFCRRSRRDGAGLLVFHRTGRNGDGVHQQGGFRDGVVTALSQIVAEELDVAFHQIHMETGDTSNTIDQAATVGSRTIERGGPQLRQAAAAARQQLLTLASASLEAPPETLVIAEGVVSVANNPAKKIPYGNLIPGGRRFNLKISANGTGWDMIVAPTAKSKDRKDYKIVGTSVPRVDLPPKFTGEFVYTPDVRVPGMLHGRVVRPAVVNSKPLSVDENSIAHIPGIVKVVQQGNFVGVVAQNEWSAMQAAKALKVTWSTPGTKLPANRDELDAYLKNTKSFRERAVANKAIRKAYFHRRARRSNPHTAGRSSFMELLALPVRWPT